MSIKVPSILKKVAAALPDNVPGSVTGENVAIVVGNFSNPDTGININTVVASNDVEAAAQQFAAAIETEGDDKTSEVVDSIKSAYESEPVVPGINAETDITTPQGVRGLYAAWDPRLYRLDAFMLESTNTGLGGIAEKASIPFSSTTIASAFYNYNFVMPAEIAKSFAKGGYKGAQEALGTSTETPSTISSETTNSQGMHNEKQTASLAKSQKVIINDFTPFKNDSQFYGVLSIMNPFTMTKLIGGLTVNGASSDNYMYDIRDKRRFYDINNSTNDVLSISNPTVSQIISWANADKWGRTPYSYQDFVFCEWFGKLPNNRLLTLRRYHAPTYDNLQFESMYGDIANKGSKTYNPENKDGQGTFSPYVTCVSYFGAETGNDLNSFLKFSTGLNWEETQSSVWQVSGDEGTNPQAKIDESLLNGTLGGVTSEWDPASGVVSNFGALSKRVVSYGKLAMAIQNPVGIDETLQDKLYNVNNDPYESLYKNRVVGPLNRIESVYKRKAGIQFELSFSLKCSYKAKAIGGVNPKAALLDILGNCLQMVSPTAVFWGGGYRFMVKPHAYPFHDGGWRDSYMKKLYDGEILGDDGAIAFLAKGIKNSVANENGEVTFDSISSVLTSKLGEGIAMIGAAVSSITSMFGGDGSFGNLLTNFGSNVQEGDPETNADNAKKRITQLFNNLNTLWHNKMLSESTLPQLKGEGAILTGEPVGEWHLTVGNPLNPIMVVGNLICEKMSVEWNNELGPDDFPIGFEVTYSLKHGMPRDNDAIQSMFNRGMGKFYELPDYISFSSDHVTKVDMFTGDQSSGDMTPSYMTPNQYKSIFALQGFGTNGYQQIRLSQGKTPSNYGNPNTQLITKFTPVAAYTDQTVGQIRQSQFINSSNISVIKSLAATRKMI